MPTGQATQEVSPPVGAYEPAEQALHVMLLLVVEPGEPARLTE